MRVPSLLTALPVALLAGQAGAAPAADAYTRDVLPLLQKYCYDCHGDGSSRGDVALDGHGTAAARVTDGKLWSMVFDNVRNEVMPPAKQPQPTAVERAVITRWIDRAVFQIDCAAPDPGRVTARRLNRQEYANSVLDLLGVEFNTREEFPPDDSGYGFDNVGDVLSLSPMLMEKYFAAAEDIARRAIVTGKPSLPQQVVKGPRLQTDEETPPKVAVREARFTVAHAGKYDVSFGVKVSSFDPFAGKVRFTATLDGRPLAAATYGFVNKLYPHRLRRTLGVGEHVVRITLDQTKARRKDDAPVQFDVDEVAIVGPVGAGIYAWPASHERIFAGGPAPKAPAARLEYARTILRGLADRAFRRPVDEATLDRLVTLATTVAKQTASFEQGIAQALQAILVSPRFLFRTEAQPRPDDPRTVHALDELSLAARLSYWLWSSVPDDRLRGLALAGRLRAELPGELTRMLADEKAERFVGDFVGQWLQTRDVEGIAINGRRYPELTAGIRKSMRRETEMSFAHIVRADRDPIEILAADYTFVDGPLAKFYGLPDVRGNRMRKVTLPADGPRGGVLTQGSFLVVTSNPTRTSPVKRGLFVLENLLGMPPPPPPPDVPNLEDARKDGAMPKTVREQLAVHREQPVCASCHERMDPIGLGLENFNVIGQWRDEEAGAPIDPRGKLVSGEAFSGVKDLRALLTSSSRRPAFYRTLVGKLMTYALGRGLEPADRCTVDALTASMQASGRMSTILLGIAQSPAFQTRRGDGVRTAAVSSRSSSPIAAKP